MAEILKSVAGPGALLTGDRRMGKTSVIRAVEAAARAQGHRVVRLSAERGSLDVTLLLERLEADHYLVRRGVRDRFPSGLVRRAWLAFRR
ncbi:MAG: AAA-like domain-containing protein [Actinomycetota bacterium]|nr:AAA-like domain-containing protein [Actinomycetota bacterium]